MFRDTLRLRLVVVISVVALSIAAAVLYHRISGRRRQSMTGSGNQLLPAEAQRSVPASANGAAYALYLRAREMERHLNEQDSVAARDLYADAIAADPKFAEAHANYAIVLAALGEKEKARAEADEAVRLDPDLGDGHFARARIYQAQEHYAEAVPEVEAAARALPNDSNVIYQAASLHRRLGQWKQSLAEFQKAVVIDPRNFNSPTELAYHLSLMRDWPAATAAWDRALAIVPVSMFNKICRAYVVFWSRGDLARGKALLGNYPAEYAGQDQRFLAWMRWDFNLLQRNYEGAKEAVENIKQDPAGWRLPWTDHSQLHARLY